MDGGKKVPAWFWEVGGALILLTWRLAWYPLSGLYRDWVAILSIYWIITACASKSRAWNAITLAVMLGLFTIYAADYLPMLLDHLRLTLL